MNVEETLVLTPQPHETPLHIVPSPNKMKPKLAKTVLRNKAGILSDLQLKQILNLLHEDYKYLGMTISIYGEKSHVMEDRHLYGQTYIDDWCYEDSLNGTLNGYHKLGNIALFSFNHQVRNKTYEQGLLQLFMLQDLFHEIRHAFQRVHMKRQYNAPYISAKQDGYRSQFLERDANQFAQRMLENNRDAINGILGIDFDWQSCWGRFYITINI